MVQMRMDGFKKVQAEDLEHVIEKDDSNSSVTTEIDDGKPRQLTRASLARVFNTNKFQIAIVCFVVLDGILVICELLVKLYALENHDASTLPTTLHYLSLSIVALFIIEISLKAFCMRKDYVRRKMELFDAVVVVVTFTLDIIFTRADGFLSTIGLLIVLRLWRVASILNGIILSVKVQADKKLQRERRTREAVEHELAKYRQYCTAQEREIEALQTLLRKHGIKFDVVEQPVTMRTIDVVVEVNTPHTDSKESSNGDSLG